MKYRWPEDVEVKMDCAVTLRWGENGEVLLKFASKRDAIKLSEAINRALAHPDLIGVPEPGDDSVFGATA